MIELALWTDGDRSLLMALNAPELIAFLGGRETDDKVTERHARYIASDPLQGLAGSSLL